MAVELFDIASFNTAKATTVPITSTTSGAPDTIVTMTTPSLAAGLYTLYYSFQITFGDRNLVVSYKFGGTYPDVQYFEIQAKDADVLHTNVLYGYPKDHAGGPITLSLLMFKEDVTAMTIDYADVVAARVG
mgnify:CR=1 FL=1